MARMRADSGMAQRADPPRIPRPVPPLVMAQGDVAGHLQDGRLRAVEHLRPDDRVRLHHLELVLRQLARLLEDRVGDADLAQVVHRGGHADVLDPLGRPAQDLGEQLAVQSGPLDVPARLFVAVARGAEQAEDGFFVGIPQEAHLLADLLFQRPRVLPPLDQQIPSLQGLLDLEDQVVPLDGLDQVAVRPEAHGLDRRGGVAQGGQHDDFGLRPALLDLGQAGSARSSPAW